MYSFSCSRRRFSLLHLLICDCGCYVMKSNTKKKQFIKFRSQIRAIFRLEILVENTHFIIWASSNFFGCRWTGHCRCNRVHYFRRIRKNRIDLLIVWRLWLHSILWNVKWTNIEIFFFVCFFVVFALGDEIKIKANIRPSLTCWMLKLLLLLIVLLLLLLAIILLLLLLAARGDNSVEFNVCGDRCDADVCDSH